MLRVANVRAMNVFYFDPHKLQMTDHICYLNLASEVC